MFDKTLIIEYTNTMKKLLRTLTLLLCGSMISSHAQMDTFTNMGGTLNVSFDGPYTAPLPYNDESTFVKTDKWQIGNPWGHDTTHMKVICHYVGKATNNIAVRVTRMAYPTEYGNFSIKNGSGITTNRFGYKQGIQTNIFNMNKTNRFILSLTYGKPLYYTSGFIYVELIGEK